MLAQNAYIRRRAWSAWHSGYPANFKSPKFDDLIGRSAARSQGQSAELMAHNLRLWKAVLEKE